MPERLVNYNRYLYGPGPIKRVPNGPFTSYGRMAPAAGFSMAAAHGVVLALAGAIVFKVVIGDPQVKKIQDYYKELGK